MGETHEVLNQAAPLVDYNPFEADRALVEAVRREGGGWGEDRLRELGRVLGSAEVQAWGVQANQSPPVLRTHDRYGHRIDEVEFHPAWHQLIELSCRYGIHSGPWRDPQPGAHVVRAAMMLLASANEYGHLCPVSMTYSVVPALRKQPELYAAWEPKLLTTAYDKRFMPASGKTGVLLGMAMTEKQGGSDVRANTTQATPAGEATGPGAEYLITGHKWFCSAPMCDGFLILAQAPGGLTCFLLPRWLPDGTRNRFFIQRLKDKLGNRSNASSEVEFERAHAWMVGGEGRGVPTIIEMANHTRLDCVLSSTAMMRHATAQALHHAQFRAAFGKKLIDKPLARNVMADLAVEAEAATHLALRVARAYDASHHADEQAAAFRRISTAVAKYWVCKRAPVHIVEALECLGGAGYVEESMLPRMYREAPLNSIWEGSGNVICLDVLRAMTREPYTFDALEAELKLAAGADRRLDALVDQIADEVAVRDDFELRARRFVEKLGLALQASLLVRHAPPAVADAFVASRLGGDGGRAFGTLPPATDFTAILERAWTPLAPAGR
ncbi:MAG TPA: isovaleryl-CoA dehydrogenase [Kofleriaceae bacterium]|nr:isovaleryl-CoA dehydrogenase [Kofleriaceae bacterium]